MNTDTFEDSEDSGVRSTSPSILVNSFHKMQVHELILSDRSMVAIRK